MLNEKEWSRVGALLTIQSIKDVRERTGASLAQAKKAASWEALHLYSEITGFAETNPDVLWHHQLAMYGPPCTGCGKPLRTPRAKRCFECGTPRAEGT